METLKYTKMLEKAGFTRNQSETHIQILSKVIGGNLVTKQDLIRTELKIEARFLKIENELLLIKQDIAVINLRLDRIELKIDKLQNQLLIKLGALMIVLMGGAISFSNLF